MRTFALVLAVLLVLVCAPRAAAPRPAPPKLAVILVVDQMRADYVDRFKGDWSAGLKRLVTKGAWFRRAAYPYLTTVTCAGHATVSSGAFPNTHGVFQNAWWDRDAHRVMTCTEDPNAKDVGYNTPVRAVTADIGCSSRASPTKCGVSDPRMSCRCRSRIAAPSCSPDTAATPSRG